MAVCRVDKNTTTYDVVWLMLKRSCREGWKASVKASVSGVPFPPLGQITNYSPDISKLNDITLTSIIVEMMSRLWALSICQKWPAGPDS